MAEKSRIESGESKSPPPRTYSRSVAQKVGDYVSRIKSYTNPKPSSAGKSSSAALADRKDQTRKLRNE